ncbi:uncharacterized protein LAESUDRAFT_700799 [Laetiporus sulphureus 93-53]|uniref:Uncharacterized protein n=1 Tax=Laetiporus sulphureus 93-53 TaxID=1314785 RepID=A0A165E6U0_9APHY|nr:uncharacterized protein LAESUDRAFT_700799 [Laetiporus sulphureus 93-53]KZT06350.1 hypothetical protein LAESUDRAFT_700799 [Laetiporus sulphureus 93-53]
MDEIHAVSDGADANRPAPATVEADAADHRTTSEQEFELIPAAEPIISRSSSQYSFDDVDGSFLEEVEAIEASFVEPLHGPGTSRQNAQQHGSTEDGRSTHATDTGLFPTTCDTPTLSSYAMVLVASRVLNIPSNLSGTASFERRVTVCHRMSYSNHLHESSNARCLDHIRTSAISIFTTRCPALIICAYQS